MLGQIFLGIIIVLFLMGTGSIGIDLLIDYERNQYDSQYVCKAPVVKKAEYFYTDDEDVQEVIEEPKPTSNILESFTMEDLEEG